jgi:DNA ligase (NAD+)
LYYIKASSIISDLQYDKLFSLIVEIENEFPDMIKLDSPTQRIEIEVQKEFQSVKHKLPLLSLENSYNAEDLKDWETFLKRQLKDEEDIKLEYFIEPKFDGVSIELIYKN